MISWRVKLRTTLVVLLVVLLCFCIYWLFTAIKNSIIERNRHYSDLMRVTDKQSLEYAINNKLEEFLISGTVVSNEEVTFPELNQSFAGIKRTRYCYESHIKTETYTDSDGDTHTRTKTVWEWERRGTEELKTNTVALLGQSFSIYNVPYSYTRQNYKNIGEDFTHNKSGSYYYINNDTRYNYEIIPKSWNITMTCNYKKEMIKNFYNQSLEEVVKPWSITWTTVVMIIFIVGIIIGGFLFWLFWENIFYSFLVD